MILKRFDNGIINIKRDRYERYLSLDLFIETLIEELDLQLNIEVERVSDNTIRYMGTNWSITYDMLDYYNWDFYIKCKEWSKHLSYNLY